MISINPDVGGALDKLWVSARSYEHKVLETVSSSIGSSAKFLEIGAGSEGLLSDETRLVRLRNSSIGVDLDFTALSNNRNLRFPVCADCYSLPLVRSSVDIVGCRWLFEHLANPDRAMKEFSRILREGGHLLIITPNLLNYIMMLSKLTPTSFHNRIRSLSGCPPNSGTFYRANTKWALAGLAERNGFRVISVDLIPNSFLYYRFSKPLFFFMKELSGLVSSVTDLFHLKILCLMQKK